jgi:ABC-type nitrate/sulfonate/bicarbonate transport system, permease component
MNMVIPVEREEEAVSSPPLDPVEERGPGMLKGLVAVAVWAAAAIVTGTLASADPWGYTNAVVVLAGGTAVVTAALTVAGRPSFPLGLWVRSRAPWFIALGLFLLAWEIATAKLRWLPIPFFPSPQGLVEVYATDWRRLLVCLAHSAGLLSTGYLFGGCLGFITGVGLGWSRAVSFWGQPLLRFLGPLPTTAWLPIVFFAFPSSWSASVFLIALASGVPVAILTWSGVAGVSAAYYDVARTLGARSRFLVLKVAVPAAMPHVFVGLFMGLSASFAVLIVAEMMGVKAGLGWYLQWAQGWAAYENMYAALLVLAIVCSSLITLLFRMRDTLLAWQKGMIRW